MFERLKEKGLVYGIPILVIVGLIIGGVGLLGYTQDDLPSLYTYDEAGHFTVNGKTVKDNPELDTKDLTVKVNNTGVTVDKVKFNLWYEEGQEWIEINGETNPEKTSSPWEWSFTVPSEGTYEFKGYVYVDGEVHGVVNKDLFVQIESKDIDTQPEDNNPNNPISGVDQDMYMFLMVIGGALVVTGFYYKV